MITLAIETSCDETSVAVLNDEKVLSNIISSQHFHSEYGGVVPEAASREHLNKIIEITETALEKAGISRSEIGIVSATSEPGLIGALLVGLNFGKSLAMSLNVPFVPVNHIYGHLYSNFLNKKSPVFPFIALIVSGGHTLLILVEDFFRHKVLGRTVDDAAGEAFDKVAKLLGCGYPGGPEIDRNAKSGNEDFYKFPQANLKNKEYDFSFSGIKTSVLYYLKNIDFQNNKNADLINNISASFQKSVVNTLFEKTLLASKNYNVKHISVSGGVSANSFLQARFNSLINSGFTIDFPEFQYSTDNAAMIGLTGYLKYQYSDDKNYFKTESFKINAKPKLDYGNF
ncbi:MAG TPA: tRNA (adenosine(37)-N6)-threonylcarbamoyltransferase complex transferase subunit TsaD [Ignavibacteria bacterium]|nr:tRNA (adenosine(37)-N6)-threonylcarbamoyltransferase complex transferase subunit TsaD [Ignavibacteria bacterium]